MRERRRAISSAVAAVVVIVVLVVGAGAGYYAGLSSAGTTASTVTVTQTGGERSTTITQGGSTVVSTQTSVQQQSLEALAKAENAPLTLYTLQDQASFDQFTLPVFQQAYPWAKSLQCGGICIVTVTPGTLYTKPLAEYKAGKVSADVIEGAMDVELGLGQAGVCRSNNITNYQLLMSYNPGIIKWINNLSNNTVTIDNEFITGFVYNTNVVKPSQAPTSYSFLSDPTWNGKIGVRDPRGLGGGSDFFVSLEPSMGNSSWTALMKGLAANKPSIQPDSGTIYSLVASGQLAFGQVTVQDYAIGQFSNDPVKWVWANPIVNDLGAVCVTSNSPHPYMGLLYEEWAMSPLGQSVFVPVGDWSPETTLNGYVQSAALPAGNWTIVNAYNGTDYLQGHEQSWLNLMQSFFGAP